MGLPESRYWTGVASNTIHLKSVGVWFQRRSRHVVARSAEEEVVALLVNKTSRLERWRLARQKKKQVSRRFPEAVDATCHEYSSGRSYVVEMNIASNATLTTLTPTPIDAGLVPRRPRKQLGRRELTVSLRGGLEIGLTMLVSQGSEGDDEIETNIETHLTRE